MNRTRRRLVTGGAVVAILATGGTVAAMTLTGAESAPPTIPRPVTDRVTEQDLAETKTVSGQVGYGPPSSVTGQGGTLTWLPGAGTIVERGGVLYKVDEQPVVALYGVVPMYRDLGRGSKGIDVRQLEENLRALGFTGFDVDDDYTETTARAVRQWQARLGLPKTGTVERGRVVFVSGAVRIAEQQGRLGGPAAGDVLSYTGGTLVVTADLDAADQRLAHAGDRVRVRLPGSGTTEATVATVETAPSGDAPGKDSPTVRLTLTVADQQSLRGLDSGIPVDVDLVAERRGNVLTVPVTALLALAEGGFGVEVVDRAGSRIVAVETGLFASGRVEVRSPELTAGMAVEVPSS